ncbi:FecR family protein [Bacteroides finegoldii]|uniref:FecR family protein n=1 Tax=Bacteroides finegoldii TaxID=338188 RepID=UPI001E5A2485|nr:FecR domain-containing protein [Bacteroides finegoldii]
MERKRNINSIIHDQLLGQLSEEEEKRLQIWIESSLENKKNYESLMQDTDLSERYRQFATVDEEQAWKKFQEKHFQVRDIHRRMLWRYAAIFMIPIIIGAAIWVGMWRNADTVPVRVQDDQLAMIRSEKMGKQKATLVLAGGQEIELKSASHQSLQDSTILPKLSPEAMEETQSENGDVTATDNNKLVTYDDSEFWLTFEDGTKVHLNYNTTLKYPSHFSAASRTVYLDGEAYFQIAKDDRPFRVITANGIVKQYGTSFNVNTHVAGVTKVVLVEGAISVLPNQGDEHKIHPGELAVLNGATQDVQISKVDIEPYIAWNSGRFVFDNCSLETLMEVISRWYDKKIMFEDEDIKTIRFTGDLDRYGSIIPILKAIQRVTHLEMDVEGEAIIIRRE